MSNLTLPIPDDNLYREMDNFQRLAALRRAMEASNLAAVILPSNDPHQSEYVASHWQARTWISGFTGSAGTAIVTKAAAGLWTDSRYFLQAEQELQGSGVTFYKVLSAGASEHFDWLKTQLKSGDRIGIDGNLLSLEGKKQLELAFEGTGFVIVTDQDPVGAAWTDRPLLPLDPIFEHPLELAGRSFPEKLTAIRTEMKRQGADHHLVVTLDDIAWIFNLRGRDVDYNPVFYAYALIGTEKATLFIETSKVPPALQASLANGGIVLAGYKDLQSHLNTLEGKLLLDPATVSVSVEAALGSNCKVIHGASPSTLMKAKKNTVEANHLRKTMEKDGVAILRLCRWLEARLGKESISEYEVSERLAGFRAAQPSYFGESFPAIAGYAGNGAIVHYRPPMEGSAILKPEGVFLLDSGGQYLDGTTDITRTFALGVVPDAARRAYTLVLRGHIALAKAKFPVGTAGFQLDPLARVALWSEGLNYGHGTGHGVGFFLNVHEGPMGIGPAATPRSRTPIEPGMLISNEPGYYAPGEFGIRIENLILCVEAEETSSGKFLAFETLSLFPIESTMIEWELLTKADLQWLRSYHGEVLRRLSPHLEPDEKQWLAGKCAAYLT
jgi:Xaa-Pro aminopeptidase